MNQNHITGIIQARVGSSKLPGKSIVEIVGKPLLAHIIDRVQTSTKITEIVIATTNEPEDLAIQQIALNYGVKVFIGSTNDVLGRFYRAATLVEAAAIVRITADDPFKDPQIIDEFVTYFLSNLEFDLVSEEEKNPSFPEGLAVSVFSFRA